jgi:hypothetical protein
MAERYTPEEIQEIFDRYNDAIRAGIPISAALAREMADATKGVKNYTYELNRNLKNLGTQTKALGSDLLRGVQGASVFNNTIGATTEVVDILASRFGVLGTVIGGVIKAGGLYIQAVNKQSDALYKSFQDLSKTGTVGAGGMAEAFSSMQKFGYSVEQLGDMTALLSENSRALAQFGGTAFQGARQFADVAQVLQRGELGEKFRNMGLSTEEINRNIAGFVKQQVGLGQSRAQMEKNLTGETAKYIEQIVAVQRLTGQTREQLEEKERQAQAEQAFAYKQFELKKRMDAGDEQARKEFQANQALNRILEGKAREQFVRGVGGDVAAMQELMMTTPEFAEKYFSGVTDVSDLMNSYVSGLKRSVDSVGSLALFNAYDDFQLPLNESLKMISQYGTEAFEKLMADALKNSKSTDEATNEQTKLLMSQMNTRQAFERMINLGVEPVTWAMRKLAEIVEGIVNLLPNFGQKGYGRGGTGTMGGSMAATGAGAASGALAGSFAGPVGTAVGAVVGGAAGFFGYEGFGGKGGGTGVTGGLKPTDVLDFSGSSGSQSAFNGLNRELQGRILAAGDQYYRTTGRKLIINSAMRSREDQERLYQETMAAGRPGIGPTGMPVARPGTSSHESGFAVDIQQGKSDKDAIYALNQQGLYQTVPSDPVHFQMRNNNVSAAFGWEGRISGPMSGYRPNLLMHGPEDIKITPASSSSAGNLASGGAELFGKMVERLDEMIYLSRSQLGVNEKILKYQS